MLPKNVIIFVKVVFCIYRVTHEQVKVPIKILIMSQTFEIQLFVLVSKMKLFKDKENIRVIFN